MDLTADAFDALVEAALEEVPPALASMARNVAVLVEDEPPADSPDLLGVYHGVPLTERDSSYTFCEPDRIVVFRGPLLRMCETAEELREEVAITVVHEIAHHFGIDDGALEEWGWG